MNNEKLEARLASDFNRELDMFKSDNEFGD